MSNAAVYHFDGVNRLSTAVATGNSTYNQTFGYDAYGNMTCSSSPSSTPQCLATTYTSTPTPTNQISYFTTAGVKTNYTYDAAGNANVRNCRRAGCGG